MSGVSEIEEKGVAAHDQYSGSSPAYRRFHDSLDTAATSTNVLIKGSSIKISKLNNRKSQCFAEHWKSYLFCKF